MDSQNGLRYLQFLHTNYNDVASSTPSLGTSSTCQYPPDTRVYSSDQQCQGGAAAVPYGYPNYSFYGYQHYPYTGQYFSNQAATTSNNYYSPNPFYGYPSCSAYNYPGYGNATVAVNATVKASCNKSNKKNSGMVQKGKRTNSKRRKVAQTASSAEMTPQNTVYPEMSPQSAMYPEMSPQSAMYPEMSPQSAMYPEMTPQSAMYHNMAAQSAINPERTAQNATPPEMTVHSAISPEMPHENLTQTTPTTSFFDSGDSRPAFSSVSFIAHSESLKKKSVNTKNSSGRKKAQNLKSVKRHLKYSPVSSNDWHTQNTESRSDCFSNPQVDMQNNLEFLISAPSLEESGSGNDFDSFNHFTRNSDAVNYGNTTGSSTQNNYDDGNYQYSPDVVYSMPNVVPGSNSYDNNVPYFDDYPSGKSSETAAVNITQEGTDNTIENSQDEFADPEDEEIPVGVPIQFEDYLQQLQITSEDFRTAQILEKCPVICKGCFHKKSDKKSSKKSSEILSKLLRDNGPAKTMKMGENSNLKYYKDITEKHCADSMTCEAVNGDAVSKTCKSSMDKESTDHIACRSPLEGPACSQGKAEWVERSIEEAGDLNHSSHLCFGCQKPVFDRYVIQVKDHGFWHADCLKCSNCHDNLSDQKSCYVKNEQVFCRNDYNILFGLSCVKCSLQFKREQDWMRVAGQHRYHIACFLCKICKRQLGNNEKYHLVNGIDIYCTNHYRDMVNGENSDGQQPPKKAKRNRTSYTEAQIKFLQDRFLRDSNPDGNELEKIATHINLKKRVVQVWFQNNRARLKKSANNNKNGNQENKNPINSGVAGNSALNDAMSIDWDNSLEQSSLDEHTYPNSASPSQMRPGSAHFMDTAYSLTPALSGPLLCLPSGAGASATMGQESGSLGDGSGSGTSTCGTPRDQVSPHFSDLSNPAYQGNESTVTGPVSRNDNNIEDVAGNVATDYAGANSNVPVCGNKGAASPNVILSALRSSVVRDKFNEGCQRRMDTRDHQEDMRHHMMLFQDQSLRQHPHFHQQPYHSDLMYGSHMGIYGNIYNMYNSYGHLGSLSADQNSELPDSHQSFLRMKPDQSQNSGHQVAEQPFDCHYSDSHIFGRSHLDINSGFSSTRASFADTNCHTTSTANTGSSGNSSPLSFLGAPNSQLHPRPSSGPCSFIQGHQISSPAACGQGHNYGRPGCGSPGLISGQNGGPSLQSMGRSNNYFTESENA